MSHEKNTSVYYFLFLVLFSFSQHLAIWSKEKANTWYSQQGWLVGSNFLPSTAINQLEMWQADTFDTATINKELGWAQDIGMNVMRVYLHDIAWQADKSGFKKRMNEFYLLQPNTGLKSFLPFLMIAGTRMLKPEAARPKTGCT